MNQIELKTLYVYYTNKLVMRCTESTRRGLKVFMSKLLCKLGLHKWPKEWQLHPWWRNKITRQCLNCGRIQDRRLF